MKFITTTRILKDRRRWTFRDEDDKVHLRATDFVNFFRNSLQVKTLSTRLFHGQPIMYMYKNGIFVNSVQSHFKECIYELIGRNTSKNFISELLAFLQGISYVEDNYFDYLEPNFINLKNGVYDCKEKRLKDHSPEYRFTTMIYTNYNPKANYDFMNTFVDEISVNRKTIQETFGYTLYRDYPIQKAILMYGTGANGKDTLLYCLERMLGNGNYSSVNLYSLAQDRFASSQLHKKHANISGETPTKAITSTDVFKSAIGGTPLYAQHKNGQPFSFVNYAKLIFSCNKIPTTSDHTYAFWRRWILLEFLKQFKNSEANKNLKYELTTPKRMEGILLWAIHGLDRLKDNMEFSYTLKVDDIEKIWKTNANSTEAFVSDCIVEGERIYQDDLLLAYLHFCDKNKLMAETPRKFYMEFKKQMTLHYPDAVKLHQDANHKSCRKGIKLINAKEEETNILNITACDEEI